LIVHTTNKFGSHFSFS